MSAIGSIDGGATVDGKLARSIERGTRICFNDVLGCAWSEIERQDLKWGIQDHPFGDWSLILSEEIGELSQAILQGRTNDAMKELSQCVSVLVRIAEKITRPIGDDAATVATTDGEQG